MAAHTKLPHHSFQYYFFAKSDLDLSIDFFRICFVSFKLFFYQIYYVLSNHNNFGRGRGGRAGIHKNVTDAGSQLTWEGGRAGIHKNVTDAGSQLTF